MHIPFVLAIALVLAVDATLGLAEKNHHKRLHYNEQASVQEIRVRSRKSSFIFSTMQQAKVAFVRSNSEELIEQPTLVTISSSRTGVDNCKCAHSHTASRSRYSALSTSSSLYEAETCCMSLLDVFLKDLLNAL
jgi:hypothetical protein